MIDLQDAEEWQETTKDNAPWYIIQQRQIDATLAKMFPNKAKNEQAAIECEQRIDEALKCLE